MTKEETLCTNCIHRHVCKYKQDYLEVTKAVLEATVNKNMESKPVSSYNFVSITALCIYHA